MTKTFIFTFLFSIVYSLGFTQTREVVDSLQHQLAVAKDDTGRINALIALCHLYRLGNTDSSLIYGQEALQSARRINYLPGQISALGFMCIVREQQGNLPKSLELGFKALQLADEHHLESLTGPALNGIGEVYIILKEYRKAINEFRTHIAIRQRDKNDSLRLAYAYRDIGVAYAGLNQLASANFYETKSLETFRKLNYEEPLVYQALGDIKMKSRETEDALRYYQKSLDISLKKNERRTSPHAYNKIATLYKNTNNTESAIYYAQKGLAESQMINQKETLIEAATLLSQLYESKDTRASLQYLKIADAYKDSIFGAGNIEAVQTLAAREEERQKEIAADKIAYRNKLKQYALIAGFLVLLLLAFFLYRNNLKEKKAKQVLQNKNGLIEQTLNHLKTTQAQLIQSEKMASLGELTAGIAHEIQNPLNFVNNFSEVNKELLTEMSNEISKGNYSEVKTLAQDVINNEEKVSEHGKRADAIVKGMLQHSRTSSGTKEPTDINRLADEYLKLAYQGLRARDKSFNATFSTQFDKDLGNINVVPQEIGRVILNLINNAFYAVNERSRQGASGYEPTVIVGTRRLQDRIEISVKDNGNGIPGSIKEKVFQPFFTTKPAGQGTGLGLSLAYDIIKAHGGEIKVETKEGEESKFIIQLPIA